MNEKERQEALAKSRVAMEKIILTPLVPNVSPPFFINPYTVLINVFALSDDGRSRNILVPSRTTRDVPTKVKLEHNLHMRPFLSTPKPIHELGVTCLSYDVTKEGEIIITLLSTRHDSAYLAHGTPLALFQFVPTILID